MTKDTTSDELLEATVTEAYLYEMARQEEWNVFLKDLRALIKQHELDARIDTINEMADAHSGWNDGCDCCASEYMRSGWSGDSTWVTDRIAELNAERERLGN